MTTDRERIDLVLEELGQQVARHRSLLHELADLADDHPEVAGRVRLLIADYS